MADIAYCCNGIRIFVICQISFACFDFESGISDINFCVFRLLFTCRRSSIEVEVVALYFHEAEVLAVFHFLVVLAQTRSRVDGDECTFHEVFVSRNIVICQIAPWSSEVNTGRDIFVYIGFAESGRDSGNIESLDVFSKDAGFQSGSLEGEGTAGTVQFISFDFFGFCTVRLDVHRSCVAKTCSSRAKDNPISRHHQVCTVFYLFKAISCIISVVPAENRNCRLCGRF